MTKDSSIIEGKLSLLEHFWEHSPDNMFVVSLDAEGNFVIDDINPAQEKNLNMEASVMCDARLRDLFDAQTAEHLEQKYHRCLEQQLPITESETVVLNGEERHWNTMIIPFIETTPPRKRIFGISREVTELKRAKDRVEALNRDLEQRVAERTGELEESNRKLHDLAFYDELTGIGNRRFFEFQAEKLIALAQREKTPTFIVMLDIDHFKVLNDSYGHPFGDTVLQALAELLKTSVRGSDVLCRYGGEEFFILLPFTGKDAALELCARLQQSIHEMVFTNEGDSVHVSVSMGLAELSPAAGTLKQLVKQADIALYRAKRNGRDRIEVY